MFSCGSNKQIAREAHKTVLSDSVLKAAHVGICIFDATAGKYLYNYQGDKYFIPACESLKNGFSVNKGRDTNDLSISEGTSKYVEMPLGFEVFIESIKVNIEGQDVYVYPDIVVIKKQPKADLPRKDYVIYSPLLIAEVLSDSTRKYDLTDKFIQYQKISSLQYYMAVEPQKQLVIFYEKDEVNNWSAKTYNALQDVILLPKLDASLLLSDIYEAGL